MSEFDEQDGAATTEAEAEALSRYGRESASRAGEELSNGRRGVFRAAVYALLSIARELQALRVTIRDKQTSFDVHIGNLTPPPGLLDKIEDHIGSALRENAAQESHDSLDALAMQRVGQPNGGDATIEQKAEELARILLRRQLTAGEARVSWDSRSGSRRARVRTARFILEECVGLSLDDATVKLANHEGWDPEKTERILQHAWNAMNDARAVILGGEVREAVETA